MPHVNNEALIYSNELFVIRVFHHSWFCCDLCSLFVAVTAAAQRKKSLSDSWMAGSACRYWPDRKASLWAYLHGAGTRMVPGQFQYKWHILKVSLVWDKNNTMLHVFWNWPNMILKASLIFTHLKTYKIIYGITATLNKNNMPVVKSAGWRSKIFNFFHQVVIKYCFQSLLVRVQLLTAFPARFLGTPS